MARVPDQQVELGVMELVLARIVDQIEQAEVIGNAERAHGVPDADEVHRHVEACVAALELVALVDEGLPLRALHAIAVVEHIVDPLPDLSFGQSGRVEQPEACRHAAQAARRVGAAAEPEQEDQVAGAIIAAQPGIAGLDVAIEPDADAAAEDAADRPAVSADSRVVIFLLLDAILVAFGHQIEQPHDIGRSWDAAILLIGGVPGSVAANDEIRHDAPHDIEPGARRCSCSTDRTRGWRTRTRKSVKLGSYYRSVQPPEAYNASNNHMSDGDPDGNSFGASGRQDGP